MKRNLFDYVQIEKKRNGDFKVSYNLTHKANIYKCLRELGFRKTKVNAQRIYFRRCGNEIQRVNKYQMVDAFQNFLEKTDFINTPPGFTKMNLLNWFYTAHPIKLNTLLDKILIENLSEHEEHLLKLLIDPVYKKEFQVNQLLENFKSWSFKKTFDGIRSFTTNSQLYYKLINNEEYLIFSHSNPKNIRDSCFDSWIAKFPSEKWIGKKEPLKKCQVKLSFQMEKDFHLVKNLI